MKWSGLRPFLRGDMPRFFQAFFLLAFFNYTVFGLSACSKGGGGSVVSVSPPTSAPIFALGDGVRVGAGWGPIESFQGQAFRWAMNDAELITCPDSKHKTLTMQLEPGPSLGSKSLALDLRIGGRPDKKLIVSDRRPIVVELPSDEGTNLVTLHTVSKNLRVPHEPRLLNFRIFSASLGAPGNCGADIVPDGSPFKIARGWYSLETFQGETFRWVNNNAEILILKSAPKLNVEAEIGLGPSLGGRPLSISLRDAAGISIAKVGPIRERSHVIFQLGPVTQGEVLKFTVGTPSAHVPGDPRMLNFRVFELYVRPTYQ